MPTIIHLNLEQKDKVLFLLNAVKSGHILTINEIEVLKKTINNSLVGLSKLLHFINPKDYAIWDSRIFRYLTEKKSSYGIDRPQLYLDYLQGIKNIAKNKDYGKLHDLISQNFEYDIYPTRAIEITMFETDRNRQTKLKNNYGQQRTEVLKIAYF